MKNEIWKKIAKNEPLSAQEIQKKFKQGKIVVPNNPRHKKLKPIAIGQGMKVKINANIGKSAGCSSLTEEIFKMKTVEKYGAHAIMDLSIGKNLDQVRRELIKKTSLCFGTVPIYQAVSEIKSFYDLSIEKFLQVLEKQA